MFPNTLRPDLLYLAVFGPGCGESIVLRIPPDKWVVVDGCRSGRLVPAENLLAKHSAGWSGVVLTHPHLDHASGLEAVLERPGSGPVGCSALEIDHWESWYRSQDPDKHIRNGPLEQVLAAIWNRWQSDPASQWKLRRGSAKSIGDAELTVLHPDSLAISSFRKRRHDPNRISTALLVRWKNTRIVLGSDVIRSDWTSIGKRWGDLPTHSSLKIPHHGSIGAQSEVFAAGGHRRRSWIVTPFNRQRLPRFDDAGGIAWLLKHVDEVALTGMPVKHQLQAATPARATRKDLRDGRKLKPSIMPLPGGIELTLDRPVNSQLDCYIAVGFTENGDLAETVYGPGSVIISA